MLVVDASVAVAASHSPVGLARLNAHKLVAPYLLQAEAGSVLHEKVWRQEVTPERGRVMLSRIASSPVELVAPAGLLEEAWAVADEMGWAKTYDAHYVALARLLRCRMVTIDERLLLGIARLGIAVRPREV